MRVYVRQKLYSAHVRDQTNNGYVNKADGTWVEERSVTKTECSDHKLKCVRCGTKGKRSKYE